MTVVNGLKGNRQAVTTPITTALAGIELKLVVSPTAPVARILYWYVVTAGSGSETCPLRALPHLLACTTTGVVMRNPLYIVIYYLIQLRVGVVESQTTQLPAA